MASTIWNWERRDWPHFRWNATRMAAGEEQFLVRAGVVIGTTRHLAEDDHKQLLVELMSGEAATTSAIEGEMLESRQRAVVDPEAAEPGH